MDSSLWIGLVSKKMDIILQTLQSKVRSIVDNELSRELSSPHLALHDKGRKTQGLLPIFLLEIYVTK